MAPASSVVSARAMALGSLSQHRNETQVADSCSAPVAGFYAAVDTFADQTLSVVATQSERLDGVVFFPPRPHHRNAGLIGNMCTFKQLQNFSDRFDVHG